MLECVAGGPREDRAFHRIKGGDDTVDALAVPPKRYAFPTAARLDVGDFGDNDLDRGLDPCTVINSRASGHARRVTVSR